MTMNLVLLEGKLARPAQDRLLPSGDRLVLLEVTVPREGSRAETAPVAWFEAPAWASALEADQAVLVIGRVRRRFFRNGAATQSRTEVVAERVVRSTDRAGRDDAVVLVAAAVERSGLASA